VWAFWRFASAVWPARPAVLGTLLFAVSYYAVYYSQNARGYSAFLFFALLATALLRDLLRTREADRRLTRVAYALAVALGLYALPLMVFIAAAHAALLLVWRRWRLLVTLCLALALAAVLYAPMGLSLIEYYRAFPTYTGFPVLSFAFARTLAPIAVALAVGAVAMVPVMGRFAKRDRHAAALLVVPAAFNVLLPVVRGQGVYPRTFIFGLVIAYALLVETLDYLFARRLIGWLAVGAIAALSIAQLVPYYQLPKQGFRQALAYVNEQMLPGDERVGFTLGGKALRFYDSTIRLIDSVDQLRSWTGSAHAPAWILSTFPTQMADDTPELASWLQNETVGKAEFPGVVGDGTVYVHYWVPPKSAAEDTGR
jgi:hypothetical protein